MKLLLDEETNSSDLGSCSTPSVETFDFSSFSFINRYTSAVCSSLIRKQIFRNRAITSKTSSV